MSGTALVRAAGAPSLRDQVDELQETVRQLRDAFAPPAVMAGFPVEWELTRSERTILAALYASRAAYVTKDALMHALSDLDPDDPPDDKLVDVFLSKLRKKLALALIFETVWGTGYRLRPFARAAIAAYLPGSVGAEAADHGDAAEPLPDQDLAPVSVKGLKRPPATDLGRRPAMRWLPVELLGIDRVYQREIFERGRRNVQRIAAGFDWSRFAPVIVAPTAGGRFAIIDGQHRATAAALAGISEVPAYVVAADRAQQARAFAAINGAVTAITPMQLYHASVTAGDPKAVRLAGILEASGARILKYPVPADLMKPGDTLAAGALMKLADQFDDDTLIRSIQCVTETAEGNPGMLRAAVVRALATVLGKHPLWRDGASRLFEAMDGFALEEAWDRLSGRGVGTITDRFATAIATHLQAKLGAGVAVPEAA